MKILYVISSTDECGGATKSFLNMVKGVKERGNEIIVITPDDLGVSKMLKSLGIVVYSFPFSFDIWPSIPLSKGIILYLPRLIRRFVKNHKAVKRLEKILDFEKPDIVHTNVSPITIGFKAAHSKHIPHIFHIREYGDKDFGLKIRNIKKILSQSYTISITKDIASYRRVLNNRNNRVIYNGILPSNSTQFIEPKDSYFLYAGRITENKGIGLLIDGYVKYASNEPNPYRLLIAGRIACQTSLIDGLKSVLIKKGLLDKVIWLGEIPNVHEYMQHANATVIPSLNEGFGRVMAEAYFNGSVVIGKNTAGTKEQFDNGVEITGAEIGFRFDNSDQLSSILSLVTKNPNSTKQYVLRGQQVCQQLYSTEANTNQIIDFYQNILNNE